MNLNRGPRTHRTPRTSNGSLRGVAVLAALVVLASACSGGRSTEAFCNTLVEEQDKLQQRYEGEIDALEVQGDPWVGLLGVVGIAAGAQGDLVVYFDKLADVAPREIQAETEAVRDALKSQADATGDAASDPLGALFGNLLAGFQSQGSMDTVNNFAMDNCGRSV